MDIDRLQELIERPSESLAIEYKGWISADSIEGTAKIIRTAIAIRNYGGGYIVFGFKNTGEPDLNNAPENNETIKTIFHIDKIQGMITRHSSEPFEVKMHYRTLKGIDFPTFPIIEIPSGIKSPVAAKSNLLKGGNKYLIKANSIYVRTLLANNTPSTAEASWKDYARLVEICFDNREADIGRFLRRHLGSLTPEFITQLIGSLAEGIKRNESIEDKLSNFILECEQRFEDAIKEREIKLPEHGSWEVALIIQGNVPPFSADKDFLNLIYHTNPHYTGWPAWLIMRSSSNQTAKPYVNNNAWEALLVFLDSEVSNDIDFYRLDPKGRFFLRRAFEDDLATISKRPKPLSALDYTLVIYRIAEAIAVGLAFARAMGCEKEGTNIAFGFIWSGLKGRKLTSWIDPFNYSSPGTTSYENKISSIINIPLNTPDSALAHYVYQATKPLFAAFEGFTLNIIVVEHFVQKLLERK